MWPIVSDQVACSVGRSVCHLVTEPCKNGSTNQDVIWVEDLGGPKEPNIRWGPDAPMGRGNFEGRWGGPMQTVGTLYGEMCKNGWNDRDAVWVMGSIPQWEVAILGVKGLPILKYGDALLWAVQKWLSQSSSRLGWGLCWAQGTILDGVQIPHWERAILRGKGWHIGMLWRELCKNSWTDLVAVYVEDSVGPKDLED